MNTLSYSLSGVYCEFKVLNIKKKKLYNNNNKLIINLFINQFIH